MTVKAYGWRTSRYPATLYKRWADKQDRSMSLHEAAEFRSRVCVEPDPDNSEMVRISIMTIPGEIV